LATLPELAELAALRETVRDLDHRLIDLRTQVEDLTAEQEKVDADVEVVKARRARDRDRMDQGLVGSPKDLERMQQELVSLERRIGTLEDEELDVMERLEEAQRQLTTVTAEAQATRERGAALVAARDEKAAALQAELDTVAAERGPAAVDLPEDLLALYDKLRAAKGGVGAAALRARECGGCRLSLDPAELASIRAAAPDEVIRHEECQRILVRTPESGL
jgi:predicted  nucleic acid-binding Zn-ribbon protein